VRVILKEWDWLVLPLEGKVFGKPRRDGTRKEIGTYINCMGYHLCTIPGKITRNRARVIWYAVNGRIPEGMEINHKNHITTDDRIENLELVTPQQNSIYRRRKKNNTTGFIGVFFSNRYRKYQTQLKVDGCNHFLGYYKDPEEGARIYDKIAYEWAGRHAILNFPEEYDI
jgi:hypothetical protein